MVRQHLKDLKKHLNMLKMQDHLLQAGVPGDPSSRPQQIPKAGEEDLSPNGQPQKHDSSGTPNQFVMCPHHLT